jgi:hypothetical protein
MRRAIKSKLTDVRADRHLSTALSSDQTDDGRAMADRVVGFIREKSTSLVSTVQEHVVSMADTTGALAKQKLLQTLISSGVIQNEHIRHALQLGQ